MHFPITPQISLQAHWFTSLALQHQHFSSSQQPKPCPCACCPSPGRRSWAESSSKRIFCLSLQSELTGRKKALRAWQTSVFRRWWWKKPGGEWAEHWTVEYLHLGYIGWDQPVSLSLTLPDLCTAGLCNHSWQRDFPARVHPPNDAPEEEQGVLCSSETWTVVWQAWSTDGLNKPLPCGCLHGTLHFIYIQELIN